MLLSPRKRAEQQQQRSLFDEERGKNDFFSGRLVTFYVLDGPGVCLVVMFKFCYVRKGKRIIHGDFGLSQAIQEVVVVVVLGIR
jgi:hypothetical protein